MLRRQGLPLSWRRKKNDLTKIKNYLLFSGIVPLKETLFQVTTTTKAPSKMCSDNVMFSASSNSYPHGKLTCYDDQGSELEKKEEGQEFSPGTTCVFLSTGHVSTGGFVIEMFCQESSWQVVLTEL